MLSQGGLINKTHLFRNLTLRVRVLGTNRDLYLDI